MNSPLQHSDMPTQPGRHRKKVDEVHIDNVVLLDVRIDIDVGIALIRVKKAYADMPSQLREPKITSTWMRPRGIACRPDVCVAV